MSFRALVCGGRHFEDVELMDDVLCALRREHPDLCVVHGGAPGADQLAGKWAERYQVPCAVFRAYWGSLGVRAGPVRNRWMLEHGMPHLVVAFPGNAGTYDMILAARTKRVTVQVVGARVPSDSRVNDDEDS